MAFLENCAIHASSPSIWRRLSALGLKRNPCIPVMTAGTKEEPRWVVVENGKYYDIKAGCLTDGFRDCGTDENLFLAVAAMRDDTDQGQVFIYEDGQWGEDGPRRVWFKCCTPDVADHLPDPALAQSCRKATLHELLEHFRFGDGDECRGRDVEPTRNEYE